MWVFNIHVGEVFKEFYDLVSKCGPWIHLYIFDYYIRISSVPPNTIHLFPQTNDSIHHREMPEIIRAIHFSDEFKRVCRLRIENYLFMHIKNFTVQLSYISIYHM